VGESLQDGRVDADAAPVVTPNSVSGQLPRQSFPTDADTVPTDADTVPTDADAGRRGLPVEEEEPGRRPRIPGSLLVFLASAAVLVLEIVAMRLAAPYIGVTLQTSSAVIGTALTAMALGAWLGGRLADRVEPRVVLGPLFVVGGLLTMLIVPVVRQFGPSVSDLPDVVAVLVLAVLAVFLPAGVLSAITPVVIKHELADLGRTGSVVGRMSGIATAGGIGATFLTGFVLLAAFRTSDILIGTGILLLAPGGWLLLRRPQSVVVGGTMCTLALLPWAFVASPNPCQVETQYHCVRVEQDQANPTGRRLWLDTLNHSYVDLGDARILAFEYVRTMAALADVVRPAPDPIDGLYVGGGGFTLPRYEAATRPGSSATVVEIDPGVVDVSRRYLGARDLPQTVVRVGDGRTVVAAERAAVYDVVFGDAFGGLAVPWHLATREAAADVHRVLRPGGVYLVNVVDYQPESFIKAEIATLRSVFRYVAMTAPAGTVSGAGGGNHVLVASDSPLPMARIAGRVPAETPGWAAFDPDTTARFVGAAMVLTDDLAPVDQLITTHPAGV
jgi:MFS family permease